MSWNCQGLVNSWTIRHFHEMRKEHFSDIFFLMEAKNTFNFVLGVHGWLGYNKIHTVEPVG